MSLAVETSELGKRFRGRPALEACTISVPEGGVVGLVGPNGAGKTTLLELIVGLLRPSAGSISVLSAPPSRRPPQLACVGYVAQNTPVYRKLSVGDHLQMGRRLNPSWDQALAAARMDQLGIDRRQRAGDLSGGQRAQLALALAVAKRPRLLILDEPVASLDPLARREFLQSLMEITADQEVTVIISSHLIGDLQRACDYLVILARSRVQLSGEVEALLEEHRLLTGPRSASLPLPAGQAIIEARHTDRQSTLLVRGPEAAFDHGWDVTSVGLEDLVLAYMRHDAHDRRRPELEIAA